MRPTSCEADRHLVHLPGCLGRWALRPFYVDFVCGFWIICSCMCSIGWSIHLLLQVLIPDPSKRSAHDDGSFALSKFSLEHSLIWQDHLILLRRQSPMVKPTMVSIQAPAVTCKTHLYKPPDQGCGCAGTVAAQWNVQIYSNAALIFIHLQLQSLTIQTPFWHMLNWQPVDSPQPLPFLSRTRHLSFRQLCAVGRWCSFFWSICLCELPYEETMGSDQ